MKDSASRPGGSSGDPVPDPRDIELIELVATKVVAMRMSVPAILFIESSKPLSFLGSQLMYFFEPIVRAFLKGDLYTRFAALIEDRGNVELLLQAIEHGEAEFQERVRAAKKAAKERQAEERARRRLRGR